MVIFKKTTLLIFFLTFFSINIQADASGSLLDHTLERLSPKGIINLQEEYAGKVILAVNTASGCGFTPQYDGLEKLHQKYKDQGLVVLGFPSNDFYQEQKDGDDIVEFCRINFGVSFPIFKKSSVKGSKANVFYKNLASAHNGKAPKWNFFKYLIDQNQEVIALYPSQVKPLGGKLEQDIKQLLDDTAQSQ